MGFTTKMTVAWTKRSGTTTIGNVYTSNLRFEHEADKKRIQKHGHHPIELSKSPLALTERNSNGDTEYSSAGEKGSTSSSPEEKGSTSSDDKSGGSNSSN